MQSLVSDSLLPPGLPTGQLACLHLTVLHSREAEALLLGLVIGLVVGLLVPQQLLFLDIDPITPVAWQVCTHAEFCRLVACALPQGACQELPVGRTCLELVSLGRPRPLSARVCHPTLTATPRQQLLGVCRLAAPPHLTPAPHLLHVLVSRQAALPTLMAMPCSACMGQRNAAG